MFRPGQRIVLLGGIVKKRDDIPKDTLNADAPARAAGSLIGFAASTKKQEDVAMARKNRATEAIVSTMRAPLGN